MINNGRHTNGTFAPGNPGGPGRPRRAVEREYLAALLDVIPLDVWKEIVSKAVDSAKLGDAKARDWIARFVLGTETPLKPSELAADEVDVTAEEIVETIRNKRTKKRNDEQFFAKYGV